MKISIITATYDSSSTIRDTMESVLRQSYPDYEHIIVDGASKDNTLDIVRELESRYEGRLKWSSEPDKGIYDAMNKGIAMATGDIVGILNSDDFYTDSGVLSKIAVAMFDDNVDAVYGDIHYVNPENLTKCVRYYSSRSFRPWQMRLGIQPAHPSFYCRKAVYDRHGAFDTSFKVASDFENLLRLIYIHKINIRYIPLDFVTMRMGGASTSGLSSHRHILADHLRAYRKNGVDSNLFLDISRYAYKICEVVKSKVSSPQRRQSRGHRQ